MKAGLTIIFFLSVMSCLAQQKILLVNGFLHVGNGEVQESALIGIENGKIILLKNALTYPFNKEEWDTIIELNGRHVYPGFVASNSTLGITEVDALKVTRDFQEVGQYNPHVRSQIAFNVESQVLSVAKTNGILLTQTTPRGGVICGSSSIMATEGWNWEDATLLKDDGVHLNWPEISENNAESKQPEGEKYQREKRQLIQFFELAKNYAEGGGQGDIRLNALVDCFKGTKRVYFHADELQQLLDIIDFAAAFKLPFPVIVGGNDSYLIGRKLKDAKIPVMLSRIHRLPEREDDPIDLPYRLPALLQEQGVLFCIQNQGSAETSNARNLPFQAGTAMAYGLTEEQAIRSLSLSVCEILGIDKNYGSVELGKSATLFVSDGNALDMRTNHLFVSLINGKFAAVENFQTTLYQKYSRKYGQN